MGPKERRSTLLTPEQEAACVAFRRHTLLSLDDRLHAPHASFSHLTRSALHRCFQRHGGMTHNNQPPEFPGRFTYGDRKS
jgi:hypothetical protein